MSRQIVVEVVGDASGLARATATATEHVSKMHSVITGIFQGVGQRAYSAVEGAIDSVISKVAESGAVFREDQVSIEKMTQALKNTIPNWDGNVTAINAYAAAQARLGFEDDQVRDSLSLLSGVTHDVAEAERDEALAQDLARAKGLDLATATGIITKAHEGNFKSLKSLGIEVDKHATAEQALAAIYGNVKGQAEAYANTSAGKLAAANAQNHQSWSKIGAIVDRISQVVLPIFASMLEKVADAVGPMAEALGKFFQSKDVQEFWAQVQPVLKMLGDELGRDLPPLFKALGEILKVVMPVAGTAIKVFVTIAVVELRALVIVIQVVSAVIRGIATVVSQVVPAVVGGFNSMVATVTGLPSRITAATGHMWDGIKNSFRAVLNAIIGMWNHLHFSLPKVDAGPIHTPAFDLKVPQIPYFHSGGIVPGSPGQDVLAMLQAGERVSPAGRGEVQNIFNFNIGTYVGDASTLSKMLAKELRLTGVAFK